EDGRSPALQLGGKRCEHGACVVRLHGEHDEVGLPDGGGIVRGCGDAELSRERRTRPLLAFTDGYLLRPHPVAQQAPDECAPHVAGAQDCQLEMAHSDGIVPGVAGRWTCPAAAGGINYPRGPKIAVPIRTMVAPSWIAASKSPLIPIDSVSRPRPPAFRESRSALSLANHSRCRAGSACSGGMHMSPRSARRGKAATAAARSGTSAAATRPLVASPARFTWMQTFSAGA